MSDFAPTATKNFHFRPLNKGMVRTETPTKLPPGAFVTIDNYLVTRKGLKRRPGITDFAGGTAVEHPPARGIGVLYKDTGTGIGFFFDTKYFYKLLADGAQAKYWEYETSATVTITGGDLDRAVSTGLNFSANNIIAGDMLMVESGSTVLASAEIGGITNKSYLDLESAVTDSYAGADFTIYKAFAGDVRVPTYTIVDNLVVLADGNRELIQFNGDTVTNYCESGVDPIADSILYFEDRLWAGRIQGGANLDHRYRTMWTGVADHDYFDSSWFLDLPYVPGELVCHVPLGQMLVAYFKDSIWLGRPTNVPGNDLPYAFEQLPTGRVGLVGPRAVCQWLDGHFFLGQDGPYYLSASGGIEPLGDVVADDMINDEDDLEYSQVIPAPSLDSVLFGITSTASGFTRIWAFNYKSRAWSYWSVSGTALALEEINAVYTWDGLAAGVTWDTGITGVYAWSDALATTGVPEIWVGQSGYVRRFEESDTTDVSANIACQLVTGDLDFDAPDITKIYLRLGVKIDQVLSADLDFVVQGSVDLGDTWKSLGTLTITAGRTEGFITFRMIGSTIRFQLDSSNDIEQYTIIEYSVKVKGAGQEVHLDQ